MISIKVKFGGQFRRASFSSLSFAQLSQSISTLFSTSTEGHFLLYRDDEDDWIHVSSEPELEEAIRINEGKVLHFVVKPKKEQKKAPQPIMKEETNEEEPWYVKSNQRPGPFVIPLNKTHPSPSNPPSLVRPPFFKTGRLGPFFPFKESNPNNSPASPEDSKESTQLFEEKPSKLQWEHPAICDNCKVKIVGVRHKCEQCVDYDLCNSCINNKDTVHQNAHTFKSMEKSWPKICRRLFKPNFDQAKTEVVAPEAPKEEVQVPEIAEPAPVTEELDGPKVDVQVPEEKKSLYESKINTLHLMGFTNDEQNELLLQLNEGDLGTTVLNLLDSRLN